MHRSLVWNAPRQTGQLPDPVPYSLASLTCSCHREKMGTYATTSNNLATNRARGRDSIRLIRRPCSSHGFKKVAPGSRMQADKGHPGINISAWRWQIAQLRGDSLTVFKVIDDLLNPWVDTSSMLQDSVEKKKGKFSAER